jgi:DNA-binding transcriptional ArsR family regulator
VEKHGKFSRYFSVRGRQLGEQQKLMALLRQKSLRGIVLFILTNKRANNAKIASALGLSPSTVSWHISKLLEAGIIERRRRGRRIFFRATRPEEVAELLKGYRRTFLDEMVDNFVEVWESLAPVAEQPKQQNHPGKN